MYNTQCILANLNHVLHCLTAAASVAPRRFLALIFQVVFKSTNTQYEGADDSTELDQGKS